MDARRFERWLAEAIEERRAETDEDEDPIRDVEDFVQAGMLTNDRGLVVRFADGSEIQVTLVQSRCRRDDDDDEEGDEQ